MRVSTHAELPPLGDATVTIGQQHRTTLGAVVRTMLVTYPRRTLLASS